MKSVIFFNRKKLYLVFPVAYLSMQLKNFELVPVTFSELITRGLKDNEEAYILGIGPTDETEDTELLFFLEKNSTRIKFWLTEHDFNDILRCVKNYEKVMSLYSPGQSCLPELAKLGYTLPQSWQKNSSFIFHNIQESEKNGKQALTLMSAYHVQTIYDFNVNSHTGIILLEKKIIKRIVSKRINKEIITLSSLKEKMEKKTNMLIKHISKINFNEEKYYFSPFGSTPVISLGEINPFLIDIDALLETMENKLEKFFIEYQCCNKFHFILTEKKLRERRSYSKKQNIIIARARATRKFSKKIKNPAK